MSGLNRFEEALLEFDRAIELNPALARAYRGKGVALVLQRKHAEALVAFDRAIQLNPGDPAVYMSQGLSLLALKQWRKGLRAWGYANLLLVKAIWRRFFWPARRS